MNEDRNENLDFSTEEWELVEDIINGLYVQTDESINLVNNFWAETIVNEDGSITFKTPIFLGYEDNYNQFDYDYYTINVSKFNMFNQNYVKLDTFLDEINGYFEHKIDNNLYVTQCYQDGDSIKLQEKAVSIVSAYDNFYDQYDLLSPEEKKLVEDYYYNVAGSQLDMQIIDEFSRRRVSDKVIHYVKGAIDALALASVVAISAVAGGPCVTGLLVSCALESINVGISIEQEEYAEAVFRIVAMAIDAGVYITSIVKSGSKVYNFISSNYSDDVAKAISKYGDDFTSMASEYGDDVILGAKRYFTEMDDYILTHPIKVDELKWIDETSKLIPDMIPDKGFDSFTKLKTYLGDPGDGMAWHHIVEQSQVGKRAGFSVDEVNNVKNVISIPHGSGTVHSKISGHYSSKFDFTEGLTVRDWLATQSFEEQFKYGKELLEDFGEVIPTDKGWIFKPFE